LWVVVFISYITLSVAVLWQNQKGHAISTFHSKKEPIGPPRPRDQVHRQGNEEDDYYEYYDENETSASTTQNSLTAEESVRKLTARPPGFGPPQAVSTKRSSDRISIDSLKSNTQRGFVDGSFGSRFAATTTIPKSSSHSSGDMRNSIPVPVLTRAPLSAGFIGPLNFVQPDQPFLVGRNVVVRSGKEISSLRGKFASLPSLPSNNVFLSPVRLPFELPWADSSSLQSPNFRSVQPSEFFPTLRSVPNEKTSSRFTNVLNGVEHDKFSSNSTLFLLKTIPHSDQIERTNQTSTDRTVIAEETEQPLFSNHQEAFKIISIPSNDFRISERTQTPQRAFSVTTSVQLSERPLLTDNENPIIQATTLLPSSTSSSKVFPPNRAGISPLHENISSTSDDIILPNGVLSFTEADFSQAFRVGHNIVRVKLNTEETTTSPSNTTSKHTKRQMKSTPLALPTATKKIDLPETSEFSESPFAYYDDPQKVVLVSTQGKHVIKSTLGEARLMPSENATHKDSSEANWGAKHEGVRLSYVSAQETSRTFPKQPATEQPSTSLGAQQRRNQTKPHAEVSSKNTVAYEPSNTKPLQHQDTLQQPSSFPVGSPSLYGELPKETLAESQANAYRDPENKLQTTEAFEDGRRTFQIDARRMRMILDDYLPKSLPTNDASNSVVESSTKEAFNENQRNKLIEDIISAIESLQRFSKSVRREMSQDMLQLDYSYRILS
uniref:Uncharacterized protein n=2 Tax=Parascaris TaxID=6254 RepID=A0A915AJM0_PARUN